MVQNITLWELEFKNVILYECCVADKFEIGAVNTCKYKIHVHFNNFLFVFISTDQTIKKILFCSNFVSVIYTLIMHLLEEKTKTHIKGIWNSLEKNLLKFPLIRMMRIVNLFQFVKSREMIWWLDVLFQLLNLILSNNPVNNYDHWSQGSLWHH